MHVIAVRYNPFPRRRRAMSEMENSRRSLIDDFNAVVEDGEKLLRALAALAAVFLCLGALLFAIFVVILFWDSHRIAAAGGMTIAYLAVGGYSLLRLKRRAAESPPPFEATLAELKRDVEALRGTT